MDEIKLIENITLGIRPSWLFMIFAILGFVSLVPWNFYLVSKRYFDYAFRELNSTNNTASSSLQKSFESYLAFITHVASVIIVLWNGTFGYKQSLSIRIIFSLILQTSLFVVIMIFVYVDTDSWQNGFFILTMSLATITVGFMNLYGSALMALLAKFPPKYTNIALSAQSIAGVLPCLADILSTFVSKDPKIDAIVYFSIVIFTLLIGLFVYFILYKMIKNTSESSSGSILYENADFYRQMNFKSLFHTFKLTFRYQFLLFFSSTVTFIVFPGIVALTNSINRGTAVFYDKYYISVFCFLTFNIGDFIGRSLCELFSFIKANSYTFTAISMLRTLLIFLFFMCNIEPRLSIFPNTFGDIPFLVFMFLLSITNGYIITKIFIHGPRSVSSQLSEITGQLLQISLIAGILFGSLISLLIVKLKLN